MQTGKIIATREKITHKALELFNQNGIEYVGMRELAASIDMKIGNITYYFPTKDQLVNALALELSALNRKAFAVPDNLTMLSFLGMREAAFRNQWEYRCLLLSFVHLIRQNPIIRNRYKEIENERRRGMNKAIAQLETNGYLKPGASGDMGSLPGIIGMIARFWISDATVTYDEMHADQNIRHYIGLIASILREYATAKGRKEIKEYIGDD